MSLQKRAAQYVAKTSESRPMGNENKNIITGNVGHTKGVEGTVGEKLRAGKFHGPTARK